MRGQGSIWKWNGFDDIQVNADHVGPKKDRCFSPHHFHCTEYKLNCDVIREGVSQVISPRRYYVIEYSTLQ